MHTDIRNTPDYKAMDYDLAVYIIRKFASDFGHLTPDQVSDQPEGAQALHLYAVALGWLVCEDRWEEAGLDSRLVQMLKGA